jgi:hypothetical protein
MSDLAVLIFLVWTMQSIIDLHVHAQIFLLQHAMDSMVLVVSSVGSYIVGLLCCMGAHHH